MADDQSSVEAVNVSGLVEDVASTEHCEADKDKNSKRRATLRQSLSSMALRDIHIPKFTPAVFTDYDIYSSASHQEKWPRTVSPKTTFGHETLGFSVDAESRRRFLTSREYKSLSFEEAGSGLWNKPLSRTASPEISDFSDASGASGLSDYDIGFVSSLFEQGSSTASREHTPFHWQDSAAECIADPFMHLKPTVRERQNIISEHIQNFWLQWTSDAFPDLLHCAHFNPSFFVKSVSGIKQSSFLQKKAEIVSSVTSQHHFSRPSLIRDNEVRGDKAMQKVLYSLQKMSEQRREVLFAVGQLPFRRYLGETCYSVAAQYLDFFYSLREYQHLKWKGDFDVIILHPLYGLVVCGVVVYADKVTTPDISTQDTASKIRSKLEEAVSQLNNAEEVLLFLVSDIIPDLRIRKTIAFPNLSADQIQSALTGDTQLIRDLCLCLGGGDLSDVTGLCLCSDQLSDPETQMDVSREFEKWWMRRVAASGSESEMTFEKYQKLVARFCGSASTVTILCISPPRLCIKATNQTSSNMAQCYNVQLTLFPEQVHLLNMAPDKVFLAGPPGTGKSVMLQLMATEWLRSESDVLIVGTGYWSRAACYKLYHLLQQTIKQMFANEAELSRLGIMLYDFTNDDDVEKAVSDLLQAAKGGSLYIIVDEIGPCDGAHFMALCDKLLTQVPCLHLWAASYYHEFAPLGWQLEYFTRPLRYTSAVLREVKFHREIAMDKVKGYNHCCELNSTDCSPVHRLYHRHQHHKTLLIKDCVMCGRAIADVLLPFQPAPSEKEILTGISPFDPTQYRDVLILSSEDLRDDVGLVMGLKNAGIPVRVMTDDDTQDVATARRDVVWVASGNRARGLERKVVVVHDERSQYQLHTISRCISKLVVVINMDPPSAYDEYQQGEMAIDKSQSTESKVSEETICRPTCSNEVDCAEIQRNSSIPPPASCYSTSYKITVDLTKAISLETQDHNMDPLARCSSDTGSRTGEATENSNENAPLPMFNKHWQDRVSLSAEGGRVQRKGSDVVLQVPSGAIEVDTKVTVHSAICSKEVYIKHKLQLPAAETIVSPLVEFWAGPDFHFQKHVEIILPTCLPSDYDINLLHVYCITNDQTKGQMDVTRMERQLSELPDDVSPAAYFYVNDGQVHMMTSHFSGYVCTYCGLCQDIGLEVYAAHTRENGSLNVSIIAHFWDKLHLQDFREWKPELNSYTTVLSTTFQLTTILMPAVLQVDFVIDDEQSELWKLKETRAPTKRFCLNWSKINCENSLEHQAVKYTNLGPFSPGWKVTSKQSENETMPSKLDAYILVSHVENGATVPRWTSAQYQIDVQRSADVNSMPNKVTINNFIQKVNTLHIAQQSEER